MIKNLLDDNDQSPGSAPEPVRSTRPVVQGIFDSIDEPTDNPDVPFTHSQNSSLTSPDSVRRAGLAWSIGIAFFSAVIFMLILGWGADLLFGSSPWGVVSGIVLGSLIGFYQLFRLSAQMLRK